MAEDNKNIFQGEYIPAALFMRSAGYSSIGNTEDSLDYESSIIPPYDENENTMGTTEETDYYPETQPPVTPPYSGGGSTMDTTEDTDYYPETQPPMTPPYSGGGSTMDTTEDTDYYPETQPPMTPPYCFMVSFQG